MGFFDSVSFTAHGVSPWETSELREVFPHGVRLGMYACVMLKMLPGLGHLCHVDTFLVSFHLYVLALDCQYVLTSVDIFNFSMKIYVIEGWSQDCSKSVSCFSQYLISSPWRCYEDYNISFCKQWKFRRNCSYEQWHLNLHCLQRGRSCP